MAPAFFNTRPHITTRALNAALRTLLPEVVFPLMEKLKKSTNNHQFVSFTIDRELFAVDVMRVNSVERVKETTTIPGMPDFLEGVFNLRGVIIPVVDLRKRFGMPQKEHTKETRIILVELDNGLIVGMIVDSVKEVFQIEPENIGGVPRIGKAGMDNKFIRGVARKHDSLIIILDADKIFSEVEAEDLKSLT